MRRMVLSDPGIWCLAGLVALWVYHHHVERLLGHLIPESLATTIHVRLTLAFCLVASALLVAGHFAIGRRPAWTWVACAVGLIVIARSVRRWIAGGEKA